MLGESPDGALVVRDGSGFAAMLGLKSGDRVREANGIALAATTTCWSPWSSRCRRTRPVRVAARATAPSASWLLLNAGACPAR